MVKWYVLEWLCAEIVIGRNDPEPFAVAVIVSERSYLLAKKKALSFRTAQGVDRVLF